MLIGLRNAMMAGKRLPYDAEVEYLESTGEQWIDTGVALSNASLADVTWVVEVVNFNDGCMGTYGWNTFATMYVNFWSGKFYMRNMRGSGTSVANVPGFNTVRFAAGTSYFNGTAVETDIPLDTRPTTNMFLFAYSNPSNEAKSLCKARVSSFAVKVDHVLLADFIPVRFTNELGQSEGAMYDKLGVGGMNPDGSPRNDGLYRNRGTGAFVYGNDV